MTCCVCDFCLFFFFKQKTAYEMRISDWSSDVCSSDLVAPQREAHLLRRGVSGGEAGAEHGVGAEVGLVGRAVEVDQVQVDAALVEPLEAVEGVADRAVDVVDGALHALAAEDRKSTRLNSSH